MQLPRKYHNRVLYALERTKALRSGEIAGAGIDAFVTEPPIGSPLLELEQVIAAPHVAGSSMDSINNMGVFSARNVVKGFAELEEKQA